MFARVRFLLRYRFWEPLHLRVRLALCAFARDPVSAARRLLAPKDTCIRMQHALDVIRKREQARARGISPLSPEYPDFL